MADKPAPAPVEDKAAAPAKGGNPLIPAILAIVLAPAVTWAVANFVLLPKLKQEIAQASGVDPATLAEGHASAEASASSEESGHGGGEGHGESKGEAGSGNSYQFDSVVVNLSGTMATRFLKTSFMISGDPKLGETFASRKPQMLDITLNVLSSLTLADLEEVGSRNLIREKLIQAYNQALGKKLVEQLYFSDFVVQ